MPFGESLEGVTRLSRGTAGQSVGHFHTFSYFLGLLLFVFFFVLGFSNVLLCSGVVRRSAVSSSGSSPTS